MFDYPAVVKAQAEGGFVVTFPDVPEAITQGEDREEALLYAVEALEAALSFYVEDRRPLPVRSVRAEPGLGRGLRWGGSALTTPQIGRRIRGYCGEYALCMHNVA